MLPQIVFAASCLVGERDAQALCSIFVSEIVVPEVITANAIFQDPCRITATGSLTIVAPSGALTVATPTPFAIDGTLTNNALLTNTTAISTSVSGIFNNAGVRPSGGVRNRNLFTNGGTVNNSGLWLDSGTFTNNGVLNNQVSGLFNSASTFTNAAVMNNGGSFTSSGAFATFSNNGTVNNSGSFTNATALTNTGTVNGNSGSITNTGTFEHYGALVNDGGSTLANGGTLTVHGPTAAASAGIANKKGSTVSNSGVLLLDGTDPVARLAVLDNKGTLDNSGQIGLGGNSASDPSAQLVSSGKLNNLASGAVVLGYGSWLRVRFDDGSQVGDSVLTNHGLISSDGLVSLDPGAQLFNKGSLDSRFSLFNAGEMHNSGSLRTAPYTQLFNYGVLVNEAGVAPPSLGAPAVPGGVIDNYGLFTNGGEIRNLGGATVDAPGAVFNNYGRLDLAFVPFHNGAGTAGTGAAILNNFGTIALAGPGNALDNAGLVKNSGLMTFAAGSSMRNLAGGVLANLATGTMTVLGTITNDGSITTAGNFIVEAGGVVDGSGGFETTGGTTRNDGKLSAAAGLSLSGGVWTGTGTWDPPTVITIGAGGIVQPGNGVGTMTFVGDTIFDGELDIEIGGLSFNDLLAVVGHLVFGADARIKLVFDGYVPHVGDQFLFLDADALQGSGNVAFSVEGLPSGYAFDLRPGPDGGLAFVTTAAGVTAVPEPSTYALMLAGMAVVGILAKRRSARTDAGRRARAGFA